MDAESNGTPSVEDLLAKLLRENQRMAEQVQELQERGTRFMLEEQEFRIVPRRIADVRHGSLASLAQEAADVLAKYPR